MQNLYRKLNRIQALAVILLVAVAGGIYLTASYANDPSLPLSFQVIDSQQQPLPGVVIIVGPTGPCHDPNGIQTNAQGDASLYCVGSGNYGIIDSITESGYKVSADSPVYVGEQFGTEYPQNGKGGEICMYSANLTDNGCTGSNSGGGSNTTGGSSGGGSSGGGTTSGGGTSSSSSSGSTAPSGSTTHHSSTPSTSVSITPAPSNNTSNETTPSLDETQPANNGSGDIATTTTIVLPINVPTGSSSTITSNDNQVSIWFPKGTFATNADCSIDLSTSVSQPSSGPGLIGPYSLYCSTANGSVLDTLRKPITVSINTKTNKPYVAYVNNTNWVITTSNTKDRRVSFILTKDVLFATAPKKTTNWGLILLDIVGFILAALIVFGIVSLIRRRQRLDSSYDY
jgi:hypothetical protein